MGGGGGEEGSCSKATVAFWNNVYALLNIMAGDRATFTRSDNGIFVYNDFKVNVLVQNTGSGLLAGGGKAVALGMAAQTLTAEIVIPSVVVTATVTVAAGVVIIRGGMYVVGAVMDKMDAIDIGMAGYEGSGNAELIRKLDAINLNIARQLAKGKEKEVDDLPALDGTGKVHGKLPSTKSLGKYSKEDLEILKQELKKKYTTKNKSDF